LTTPFRSEQKIGSTSLSIETGKLAGQSGGAVTVRYGDTMVLASVCTSKEPREGVDFLPLTVEYEEKLYAAGKIPGGFIRREGRPSEVATLTSRLVDRPIRPLLPKDWRRDIQIIITVLSVDNENDPSLLAVIGSSAALAISEVPFEGPIGTTRIGYIKDQLVVNPTFAQLDESSLDLIVVSTEKAVVMIETAAKEVSEDIVLEAIKLGHETNQQVIKLIQELKSNCGKEKLEVPVPEINQEAVKDIASSLGGKIDDALNQPDKTRYIEALEVLREELVSSFKEKYEEAEIKEIFDEQVKKTIRANVLERNQRISGRTPSEIREISCEVGLIPRVHGSALFSRGITQVLNIATLAPPSKAQPLDGLGLEESKSFMHHYNFHPFSTGEVRRVGSVGRREIGHGALAEKAIKPVLPELDDNFPYVIRLVSEVLSSSGSTSMASACASSLSLMDAGVPVKRAVAGISIGLVTDEKGKFVTLTDIEGLEDHYGDMDFKVAGTTEGITAIQLDIKLKGISMEIIEQALKQAKEARLFILDKMNQAIAKSRPEVSRFAPRIYKLSIDTEKIGSVIGPGGRIIRSIIDTTKTTVDIDDDGTVYIGATDEESAQKAIKMIEELTREVEVGAIYTGKVTRIMNFGAFVEILPGKEGMVHISELENRRVDKVEDVVKIGDEITVKVTEIDSQGRINLSRRVLLEDYSPGYPDRDGGPRRSGFSPFKRRDSRPQSHSRSNKPRRHY